MQSHDECNERYPSLVLLNAAHLSADIFHATSWFRSDHRLAWCYTLSRSSESSERPDASLPLQTCTLMFFCMLAVLNEPVACQVERTLRMIAGHFVSGFHYPARGACYVLFIINCYTSPTTPSSNQKTSGSCNINPTT